MQGARALELGGPQRGHSLAVAPDAAQKKEKKAGWQQILACIDFMTSVAFWALLSPVLLLAAILMGAVVLICILVVGGAITGVLFGLSMGSVSLYEWLLEW